MKKHIQKASYIFYLSASLLTFAGISGFDWRWWAIVVPTAILAEWRANA